MTLKDLVIQSQLIPPRQRRDVLRRPRLDARLEAVLDYPLTLVQAGTGYGKSTALAALADTVDQLFWYTITEPDRDPLLFLAHLICAFDWHEPAWGEPALRALEASGGRVTPEALTPLLNALTLGLDDEVVVVLDDYHLVDDVPGIAALVERLVDYLPPRLHIVLSSRQVPPLTAMTRWHVKGQLLTITRDDLAFTAPEIETLFREQYAYPLAPEQVEALARETEGWVIALQMVWQGLQSGAVANLDAVLGRLPATFDALFDYLAHEVLARQSEQARARLTRAAEGFARVGDSFCQSAVWLWLALDAWRQGDADAVAHYLSDILPLVRERGYDYLLTRATFLGLKEDLSAVPLLIEAQRQGIEAEYAGRLLHEMGLAGVEHHPGYALAVQTLGPFAVWRGGELVDYREWQREKARQVFQFLLTHRGQWFYREQIVDQPARSWASNRNRPRGRYLRSSSDLDVGDWRLPVVQSTIYNLQSLLPNL